MAENQANGKSRRPIEQVEGVHGCFHCYDFVASAADLLKQRSRLPRVLPRHRFFGTQRRFADGAFRWPASDPAQIELFKTGRVRSAKERAHVVETAHVVE
jgi:hypothetical protein